MEQIGHFIAGRIEQCGSETLPIENPATGNVVRKVALGNSTTLDKAVMAANAAAEKWTKTPATKRASIMFKYKNLLEANAERLAKIVSEEHGKVLSDAMGEVARGIEIVDYACGAGELLKGEHSRDVSTGIDSWSQFHSLGVVAGITPFNFPAMVPMWMFPMAIACGNTFILKPSEKAPSAAMLLGELTREAGFPDGVLNVVNGGAEIATAILEHSGIEAVSFVGSTPIAERVYQTGTAHGKRVQALGGAKNHAIVMPDADLDNAANALMGAAFGSCGERCMAISVAVCVGDAVADGLIGKLKTRIDALKVGPGSEKDMDMGPLISGAHRANVLSYLESGENEQAQLVVDGRQSREPSWNKGHFLGASLFDHVTPEMKIYRDEIFGPVLCVMRVDSVEAGLELINTHEYGNGACIFTRDGEVARYFTDNVKVGMAGVNVPLPVPSAMHSFGGWKRSLFGDLHAYGPDAIRFYTRRKTVTQRWPASGRLESVSYAFPS